MSSYRKLAKKQALRLSMAIVAMTGGMTGWMATAHADGETNIQKADTANAGTITTSGNVWTVVPDKIEGDIATNAFSHFTLNQNNIANLRLYNSSATANKLVNLVNDRIDIRGTVNVLKNANTIGGDVFFLSKSGMAVGRTGVINAGSITALTPSVEWFDQHLDNGQAKISASDMDALKAGAIPLNADGSIVIDGKLNTQSGIHLRAPAITVGSAPDAAAALQSKADLDFTDLVNIGSVSAGLGTLTATTGTKGDIVLQAAANQLNSTSNDVAKHTNLGSGSKNEIKAELTVGKAATITGDQNITLSSYAEHAADENKAFGDTSSNTSAKLLGQIVKATAHATVNGKVTADGRLSVTAEAKNIFSKETALEKFGSPFDLNKLVEKSGTSASGPNISPAYAVMHSEAKAKIGADAVLTAKGADETKTENGKTVVAQHALTVGANSESAVDAGATTAESKKVKSGSTTNKIPAMAVAYVRAQSAADVTVDGKLTATTGGIDVAAQSTETLQAAANAATEETNAGAGTTQLVNLAALIARGSNAAHVTVGERAEITAKKDANVRAAAKNAIETSASANGEENSLLNVAVNVTKQTSEARTQVRGTVKGENVSVSAVNETTKNRVLATTAVAEEDSQLDKLKGEIEDANTMGDLANLIKSHISETEEESGIKEEGGKAPSALDKLGERLALGGAVNILNETQTADVILAPKARITAENLARITAESTISGTRVQAQSAVNATTETKAHLDENGNPTTANAGANADKTGMGSVAVNVASIKNTAHVATLSSEEGGTTEAPAITGKNVQIAADAHFRYTNVQEMTDELLESCTELKTLCMGKGLSTEAITDVYDKAKAYRDACKDNPGYIVSKEGLAAAKELAEAIHKMKQFITEAGENDAGLAAQIKKILLGALTVAENVQAFADPTNYMTFQASAKFAGKAGESPEEKLKKLAGAAGVNVASVNNSAAVLIGKNTTVTAEEASEIGATGTKHMVSLAGAPAWQKGADVALGGNVSVVTGTTAAHTIVAEGAQIKGKNVTLTAVNRHDGIHLAIGGGEGGKLALQGMVNYVGGTSEAVTSVDDEAKITADEAAKITATNTTNVTNIAGSAVLGTAGAVGVSVAVNNVGQTSIAAVADNDMDAAQTGDETAEQRTAQNVRRAQKRVANELTAAGVTQSAQAFGTVAKKETGAVEAQNLDVKAAQKGIVNAVAAAGGLSKSGQQGDAAGGAQGSTSGGGLKELLGTKLDDVKGEVSKLFKSADKDIAKAQTDTKNGMPEKTKTDGAGSAINGIGTGKAGGAGTEESPFAYSAAGSAAVNISKATTAAELIGANVTLKKAAAATGTKNLTVSAVDSSFTGAWSGAMAVTWQSGSKSKANAGLAGALGINTVKHRDVLAYMAQNNIIGASSIENAAVQKGATAAAALGLTAVKGAGSGTGVAVPLSFTYNEGGSVTAARMQDNFVNANTDGSVLTNTDGSALTDEQKTNIVNRAVSSNVQVSGGVSAGVTAGSQSANTVGAVVAVSNLKNDVRADITQTQRNTGALRHVGTLQNEAVSGMTQIGAAIGVGVASGSGSSTALTGSFAINNFANKTAAQLTNVTLTADSASVRADDKHAASEYKDYLEKRGVAASGDGYQKDFAKGKSNSSLAVDKNGDLTESRGSTIVTAAASIAAAVGGGTQTAAGLGVGVGVIENDFTAGVKGSDLDIKGADGLAVESVADTRAVNVAVGAAGSGSTAVAGSASVIVTKNNTSALVEDSTIKAQKVNANAITKTLLVNVAGQVSVSTGGAGVAAGLAAAVNVLNNNTTAALRGGKLALSQDGIVNLNAQNIGGIEALTAGVAAGPNAAISGGVSVNVGKNDTRAEITEHEKENEQKDEAEISGAKSVTVQTLDKTRQDAAVGGIAASTQGGAVGGSIAYNGLQEQKNSARISGAKIALAEGGTVDVNAKNEGELNTVALNIAASGGSAAFAGAVAVANVKQNTTAEIASADIKAEAADKPAGDVSVTADGKLTGRTFAIVGTGAGNGVAVGAGVAVNLLKADTIATISGGKIHAANVLTNAASNLDLLNIGMGVAGAGNGGAVSGSVAVNKLTGNTKAKITGGATVTAEKNAVVTAKSDDRIQNYSGQITASGQGAAVGLSVSTNIIGSHTGAEISGSGTEVISHAKNTDAATTVKDGLDHGKLYNAPLTVGTLTGLDGLAAGRKENAYRGVAVSASATHTANSFIANGGGAGVGGAVVGTVNTNVIGGATTARIADATAKADGADVSVRADDATNSGALVGTISVAGEGAAFGTGSSINLINRTTEAEAVRSTILAQNAAIAARSGQGIAALTAGFSFADELSVANSNNFVRMEQKTRAALTGSQVNVSGLSVTSDNEAKLNALALTGGAAGIGVGVGVGTATLLDRSTTEADIAGTTVVYRDDQGETLVRAKNTEHLNNYVYSIAGGVSTGIGASISGGDVKNTVKAAVKNSTLGHADEDPTKDNAAKKIRVTAENDVHFDQKSGTGSAGAVGASVGVSVNNFKATVESVVNNSKLYARDAVDITAHDKKNIQQLATNGAGGIAAIGLNLMVTNVGANMQNSYTMEEGSNSKDKKNADVKTHTDKVDEQRGEAADRSKAGLSYLSSNETEKAKMLAEKTAPSTAAKTSARAEQSSILVATTDSIGRKTLAGKLNISAQSTEHIRQDTMQAASGGVAISGAAGIVRNRSNTETVAAGGVLRAHTITLDSAKDGAAGLKIYQGAAGGAAVNAAYGELNMGGRNDLVLTGTQMKAHTITGKTRDESTGKVDIIGVAASAGGAGNILVGNAVHDNVQTLRAEGSELTADGDLTLSMTRAAKTAGSATLQTVTQAAAGGIQFAGNGVAALARETGSMTMHLTQGNKLRAAGRLLLKTDNRADIRAETKAASASIFAAATATYASASFGAEKNAYQNRILIGVEDAENGRTDGENTLSGRTVTISAETNAKETAHLKSLSASAGAGVQASAANINAYSDAQTLLSSKTHYQTANLFTPSVQSNGGRELQINTRNIHTQDVDARGLSAGGFFATATNLGTIKNILRSDTVAYGTANGSTLHNAAFMTYSEALKKGSADGNGGGLVAVSPLAAGMKDDTTLHAQTKLTGTWNTTGALDAKAATYDNTTYDVNALQAAVIGGSGTKLEKKLRQNAEVLVENAAVTSAGAQNYEAKNRFSHADKDTAGGYGAGTLSAGALSMDMTETAKVTFKNSSVKTTGYAGITAQSRTEGISKTTGNVKSAGVIPFTMMKGDLGVTYANSVDVIESNLATAKANASINLAAKDDTELRYELNADTQGGLAGTAGAALKSRIDRSNIVTVGQKSSLFSSRDANLYAGRGINPQTGERDLGAFRLSLIADVTNRTGIPLHTDPSLKNEMTQTNTVSVAGGAKVESVRHANLSAVTGDTQAYESAAKYTTWTGKGGQGSLTTTASGKKVKNETAHNTVQVDGSVTAGIHNKLKMNITQKTHGMSQDAIKALMDRVGTLSDAEKEALAKKTNAEGEERLMRDAYLLTHPEKGELSAAEHQWFFEQLVGSVHADVTEGSDWFDSKTIRYQEYALKNPYLEEYNRLIQARGKMTPGSQEEQNLTKAIGQLESAMEAEGYLEVQGNRKIVLATRTTVGIVLPDLAISGGDVNIEAAEVSGKGSLTAKGAPEVEVNSSADRRLIVKDVQIADAGGRVRLGETDLTADKFKGDIRTDKNTSDASISIKSTTGTPDADIELHGKISTPGKVTIRTEKSSIRSLGSINAAQITVQAPRGSVSHSAPTGTTFIGGDPIAQMSGSPWLARWLQNYVSDQLQNGNSTPLAFDNVDAFYAWLLDGTHGFEEWQTEEIKRLRDKKLGKNGAGSWVAGKDISIAARNVNINGLVQSGYSSYKVKLTDAANEKIRQADINRTETHLLVSEAETYWDQSAADGRGAWAYRPAVYYNAKEGYLFTEAMETGGGNITITGALSSTGNGRILARGGESDVSVDTTAVGRDLRLGAITNRAGGGKVTLSDHNTGKMTEYLSNGTYRSYQIGTKEQDKPAFSAVTKANGMAQYAPKAGLTYNWTGGRSGHTTEKHYSYGSRFIAWGLIPTGVVGKAMDEKNIKNGTTRITTVERSAGDTLPNGAYFGEGDTSKEFRVDGNVYSSNSNPFPDPPDSTKYYGKWLEDKDGNRLYNEDGTPKMDDRKTGKALGYGIYFLQWNTRKTTDTNNTYHVAADRTIGVDFLTSHEQGNVDVHTKGNLVLNGAIRNLTNRDYAVNLKSDAGRIESSRGNNGIAYTNNLTASAAQGMNLVQSAANTDAVSKVELSTTAGAIDFTAQRGDVQIVKAYAGASSLSDVRIRANGSIRAAQGANPAVKGANITLTSTAAVDLPIWAEGRVDVTADGDITLTQKQTNGDLRVGKISSANGDVHLTAEQGSIIDAVAEEGTLSDADERMKRWKELGLTHGSDAANESTHAAAAAKEERLEGLRRLGKVAAREMSAKGATDAQVEALYNKYQSISEAYRTDADIQKARAAYIAELKASHEAGWSAEEAYKNTIGKAEEKFFADRGIVPTSEHSKTEVDKVRTFIRDYKTLDESKSYGWSANGLRYAIQNSVINSTPGQVTEVKEPNIVGRNITLTAGANRGIGEDGTKKSIANADLMQEENLRALSNARAGELRWTESGVEITRTRPVKVQMRDGGKLNLHGDQRIYVLGKDSTLNLGTVASKGNVDLQGDKGIYGGDTAITAANLSLRAGNGGIGRADRHLLINASGVLDANASGGIYIKQDAARLLTIQSVGSNGDVVLTASKGMRMTNEAGKTDGYIKGRRITLTSDAGDLGTAADGIRIASESLLFANAGTHDVHIASKDSGSLLLGGLKGRNISVSAVNKVELKEADDKAAQLTAEETTNITSSDGSIALTNGAITAKTVNLSAKNGITQSESGSIKSNTLSVKSDGAVSLLGTQNRFPVLTMVGLSGDMVGGSVHIVNTGAMTVADLAAAGNVTIMQKGALTTGAVKTVKAGAATGDVRLHTDDKLTVRGDMDAAGSAELTAGQDIAVDGTVTTGGNLKARATNDLTVNGAISSHGMTQIDAGRDAKFNGNLTSDKDLTILAKNNIVTKEGANLYTKENGRLKAHAAELGGDVRADGTLTIETDERLAVKNVMAGGAATLNAGTNLTAQNVSAGGVATLNAGTDLTAQNVSAGKDAALTAGKNLSVRDVTAGGAARLNAGTNLTAQNVKAGGAAILHAGTDLTAQNVSAGGKAELTAGHDAAINGTVTTGGDLTAHAINDLTVRGAILSHGMAQIDAGHDAAIDGTVTTDGDLKAHATNDLTVNGAISSHGMTQIDAGHDAKFNGNLTSDKDLTILAKNNIITKEGATLYTKADGRLKAHSAELGGDVRADGTLTIETDETLSVKNVTAGKAATLKAGTDLKAANVSAGGTATLNAGTQITAQNVTAGGKATLTAGTSLKANDVKAGGAADLHSQKEMETGSISADTVKLRAEDGDIHSHGAVHASKEASVSTGTQGTIKLEKGLTAGKDITFATKNGDMLFGGDIHSTGGNIKAMIATKGDIKQIGDAKVSVKADAKGIGNVTITNSGEGDVDLHRIYADRDVRVGLAHGNIHVYEINGALVAVMLKDESKKMNLENIIAERRMIVQGADMNLDNVRVREGADGMLSIEPSGARDDRPIDNFTMGNLDLGGSAGVRFERLWANKAKFKISGGRVRFDKLFIEGRADISYAGQETSVYGTAPRIDGNVVTYWNDVNRNNPRYHLGAWRGSGAHDWMTLYFSGKNRQVSNGNLIALGNYRYVYSQRENLVDFMGRALRQNMDAALGGLRASATDGKALAMQEQAENADMSAENAKEDAITIEI